MKYENIKQAVFINRINRFEAEVLVDGIKTLVHVKNTGRCKELLTENREIILEASSNKKRKTPYSIVAVSSDYGYINIDSSAPNKVVMEFLKSGDFIKDIVEIKPEYTFLKSRLDFFVKTKEKEILLEVKGVTLREDDTAMFPDAPTLRGVKHIEHLMKGKEQGYDTGIVFVVQMMGIKTFATADDIHPEFGKIINLAKKQGVKIYILGCDVTADSLEINKDIKIEMIGE